MDGYLDEIGEDSLGARQLALSRMRDAQSNPVISRFSRFVFGDCVCRFHKAINRDAPNEGLDTGQLRQA